MGNEIACAQAMRRVNVEACVKAICGIGALDKSRSMFSSEGRHTPNKFADVKRRTWKDIKYVNARRRVICPCLDLVLGKNGKFSTQIVFSQILTKLST